jgi:hypothetical protein
MADATGREDGWLGQTEMESWPPGRVVEMEGAGEKSNEYGESKPNTLW